jgi:hypothetical protein
MCLLCFENNFLSIECVHCASKIIFFLSNVRFLFKNNLFTDGHVRFGSKIILFLSKVFASIRKYFFSLSNVFALLQKLFSFYLMCSLPFKNNLHTVGRVYFAEKIIFLLSNLKGVVPPVRGQRRLCQHIRLLFLEEITAM